MENGQLVELQMREKKQSTAKSFKKVASAQKTVGIKYWVFARSHDQGIVSSKPGTIYWMDVSDASYYIQTMKIKVAKWGTPKKYLKTNIGYFVFQWKKREKVRTTKI
jgi:hypothetical protein